MTTPDPQTALKVIGSRQWTVDKDGAFERRQRLVGVEQCDKCGGRVEFWQDTEEWHEVDGRPGHWRHAGYGMPYGFCEDCPTAYHEGFDCCYVLDLSDQVRVDVKLEKTNG